MIKQKATAEQGKTADAHGDRGNLDRQYGRIGISAVAAALPYSGMAKNPADARRDAERRSESEKRSVFAV